MRQHRHSGLDPESRGRDELTWMWTMLCIVFTLTFDSSPIKGEGTMLRTAARPPCGFWIKSRMTMLRHRGVFK